jgi:hypothetical protein
MAPPFFVVLDVNSDAVMVAFAVVISLLDWGLGEGFLAFVDLFN